MGGPERPEHLAPRGQLADEIGEVAVEGIAAGFRAQDRDDVVRDTCPSRRRRSTARRVEEEEPGAVRRLRRRSRSAREYSARPRRFAPRMSSRPLRTNAGTPAIASSMCCTVGRIPCCARRRRRGVTYALARARSNRCARSVSSSCSARASASRTVSETPLGVAALEPGVVVDADAREQRHLFATEPGDATAGAVVRSPACSGVILPRRELRNSRISFLVSTSRE